MVAEINCNSASSTSTMTVTSQSRNLNNVLIASTRRKKMGKKPVMMTDMMKVMPPVLKKVKRKVNDATEELMQPDTFNQKIARALSRGWAIIIEEQDQFINNESVRVMVFKAVIDVNKKTFGTQANLQMKKAGDRWSSQKVADALDDDAPPFLIQLEAFVTNLDNLYHDILKGKIK